MDKKFEKRIKDSERIIQYKKRHPDEDDKTLKFFTTGNYFTSFKSAITPFSSIDRYLLKEITKKETDIFLKIFYSNFLGLKYFNYGLITLCALKGHITII